MSDTISGDRQTNAEFLDWTSASVVNPKNGFAFCRGWFVTSVDRGRPMDIGLEPLSARPEAGVRIRLRKPPEQVRLWHGLPDGLVEAGASVVRVRLRGLPEESSALQLDSMALFHGNEIERKVSRRLVGAIPLNASWHEFTVALKAGEAPPEGRWYLSLRVSGQGTVEIQFCRIQDAAAGGRVLSSAKGLAEKILSGFRRTVPVEDALADGRERVTADAVPEAGKLELDSLGAQARTAPIAQPTGDSNLLGNSGFQSWTGGQLDSWQASVPRGAALGLAAPSRDQPFQAESLRISFDKPSADQAVTLSQRVAGLVSEQFVDLVVVGRAESRAEVEIFLTSSSGGIVAGSKVSLTLWPSWQRRTAAIRLPADLPEGPHGFVLIVRSGQCRTVSLGCVAACVAGRRPLDGLELRETPSVVSNALVNGRFDHWSGALVRNFTNRRSELSDSWQLIAKAPSPGLEIRLTEISPRGLRDGRDHGSVLGIALHGEIAGPYLRMEAALDLLQLFAGPPRQLRFYARRAASSPPGAPESREAPAIHQVFIAERARISAERNEYDVKRLFTLRRNVRIGRIGELHVLPLRAEQRDILAAKVRESLGDPGYSLLLIFEFVGTVDFAIGDVQLSNDGAPSGVAARPVTHQPVMEDANITSQLTLLKGLDHWRSSLPLSAPTYSPQATTVDQPHWSWLPDSRMTVDIIICVHDAVEETLGCLESIYSHTTVPHTVTIVDDKSSDVTREQLRRYVRGKPWIRLLENDVNVGYTRSANIGISTSGAEWVVLLNSDTLVTQGWLEGMFEVVKARPNAAMVGPVSNAASWQSVPDLHDIKGGWSSNPLPEGVTPDDVGRLVRELSPQEFPEATLLNGFCTLMRRSVIEEVGYLDEVSFPMGYGEENDLCLRVRKAGYSLALADHVYVYHVKSASFGNARRAELSKRGTTQLLTKHPDVDIKAVQRDMAELTSLIELRKRLRKRLNPETDWREVRPVRASVEASAVIVSSQPQ
ncbi:glycosyltransferase family 2 protein [Reyranella sp.]|uniref:glycosyltransferase family 2 protein n=1 Tax=Reyranella sp. TaxID=1929291 RepID=UPI003BACC32E